MLAAVGAGGAVAVVGVLMFVVVAETLVVAHYGSLVVGFWLFEWVLLAVFVVDADVAVEVLDHEPPVG